MRAHIPPAADGPTTLTTDAFATWSIPRDADPIADFGIGTVVRIKAFHVDEALLAVVVDLPETGDAEVVPLSTEVGMASSYDLSLDPALLGYPTMAQTWTAGRVALHQVIDGLAELDDTALEQLEAVRAAAELGDGPPLALPVGPPLDDDLHRAFQLRCHKFARQFFRSEAHISLESFETMLAAAAEYEGISLGELDERLFPSSPRKAEAPLTGAMRRELSYVEAIDPVALGDVIVDLRAYRKSANLKAQLMSSAIPSGTAPVVPLRRVTEAPSRQPRRVAFAMRNKAKDAAAVAWVASVLMRVRERLASPERDDDAPRHTDEGGS